MSLSPISRLMLDSQRVKKGVAVIRTRRCGAVIAIVLGGLWSGLGPVASASAQSYTFSTVAGLPATGNADGTGATARFANPARVAVDSAGNLYVGDTGNHTIRKMTPAGVVSTLAGLAGIPGSADGTGSAARFNQPKGVAVDSAGNVYVADMNNNTIRKITAAGVVTTLAGLAGSSGSTDGTGSAALFNRPEGVAVDPAGFVYVADTQNSTIRRITAAGVVTTLAGLAGSTGNTNATGAAARFNRPAGVGLFTNNIVYIADTGNNEIRRVSSTGGVVMPWAGTGANGHNDGAAGTAQFSRPESVAVDSALNVYVGEHNQAIRKILQNSGVAGLVSTLAGQPGSFGTTDGTGSAARFIDPVGVAVTGGGTVFVVDESAANIRSVLGSGVVVTIAGVSGSFGSADGPGSTARFGFPSGVALDAAGNVYVADAANSTIRKMTPAGVVSTLAGTAGTSGSTDGTGSAASFNFPWASAVDGSGNVLVIDSGNNTVRKITPAGVVTTLAGTAGVQGSADGTGAAASFNELQGIGIGSDGNIYVTERGNATIRKITPAGVVTTFAGSAGNTGGTDGTGSAARFSSELLGLAFDIAGNMYVADGATIRKITPLALVTTLAGTFNMFGTTDGTGSAARFNFPTAVAVNSAGNVFVTDGHALRMITAAGVVTTVGGVAGSPGSTDGPGTDARFMQLNGIAVNAVGTLYLADSGNNTIRKGVAAGSPVVSNDFDGDGKADLVVFRPASGTWFTLPSSNGFTAGSALAFGLSGDLPVPGDYDGDGKIDAAVFRPANATWYIQQSSTSTMVTHVFGFGTDIPVPGDYDGDGKTDPAVYSATRFWSVLNSSSNYSTTRTMAIGVMTDIPVPADYDGDGVTDLAVYHPFTGVWTINTASSGFTATLTFQWGLSGDVPVPGDYDGDRVADIAVWRPSTGVWFVRQSTTGFTTSASFQFGLSTDTPAPGDYDGDGKADLAVFRIATGTWYVASSITSYTTVVTHQWGLSGDIPAPNATVAAAITISRRTVANTMRTADLDGDGRADVNVYRPSSGTWFNLKSNSNYTLFSTFQWGLDGDVPVSSDWDEDGVTDLAVWRPSTGTWFIRHSSTSFATSVSFQWGLSGDVPVPGDYDGDGQADLAVWRPSTGTWFIKPSSTGYTTSLSFQWGLSGDEPVQGDYDGDGVTDLAVWRPSTGTWFIRLSSTGYTTSVSFQWGLSGDITVPADYDGDGMTDLAVWRPSTGTWFIRQSTTGFATAVSYQQGVATDTPVPADFDGDGKTDVAVYRASTGTWSLLMSSTNFTTSASVQWGVAGDVPILTRP